MSQQGAEMDADADEMYRIEFAEDEQVEVSGTIRDGIVEGLSDEQADRIVTEVGKLVARKITENGDADDIVLGVKDQIVYHLIEGRHSDAVVERTADIVLDNLPGAGSMLIRRAMKRIVKGLLGRSDRVVAGVGDVIGEKLVEGDHTEALVGEVATIVVKAAIEGDYSEDLVEGTVDDGHAILVDTGGIEAIVEDMATEYGAEAAA